MCRSTFEEFTSCLHPHDMMMPAKWKFSGFMQRKGGSMKTVKKILNIVTWIIAIFFQFVYGVMAALYVFTDSYANVIAMWAGMTLVVFIIGVVNIIFRKSIIPKKYLSRLGFTGLGTFIFSFVFYQFDFHYGWDYFFESFFPLLAPVTGIVGFYLLDLIKRKSNYEKVIHQIGNAIAFFVLIAGIYTAWELLTPFHLPLQYAAPGQSSNVELVKQIGGSFDSSKAQSLGSQEKLLVVRDDLMYVGMGPRLAILDISDPSRISLVGQSEIIPDEIGEIVLVGNYAYIAPGIYGDNEGNNQKLHIVNVSNPTRPQYVGMYSPEDRYVSSVYIFNDLLFVTGKGKNTNFMSPADELYLLDITNPSSPKEIVRYLFKEGIADIAVFGNYAYIAMNGGEGHGQMGVRILDISNPQALTEINALFPKGAGSRILVNEHSLYYYGSVAGESIGFHILDISAPQFPKEVAVREGFFVDPIFVSGNRMYLGGIILDTTNPLEPNEVGTPNFDGALVSFQENLAVTIDDDRLKLYDLTNPSKSVELGEYVSSFSDEYTRIYVDGINGIIETADGLYVVDFSHMGSPVVTHQYTESGFGNLLKMQGNIVYLTNYNPRLYKAIDISNVAHPTVVWQSDKWDGYTESYILLVAGKYAYMNDAEDGFYIYDVSNPDNPVFIGHQADLKSFGEGFDDYAVAGNYMYILDGREIHVLDVSDKTKIAEVGSYSFPSSGSGYRRITIIENLAFLDNSLYDGNEPATLTILDLSDPTNPRKVTSFYWSEYSGIGGSSKQTVFITDHTGLHIVDFSNPKKPKEIGYYGLEIWSCGYDCMALGSDNIVYVYGYPSGLYVLRFIPSGE